MRRWRAGPTLASRAVRVGNGEPELSARIETGAVNGADWRGGPWRDGAGIVTSLASLHFGQDLDQFRR